MEKYRSRHSPPLPIAAPAERLLRARAVLAAVVDWHADYESLGRVPRTKPPRVDELQSGVDLLFDELAKLPLDAATLCEFADREQALRDGSLAESVGRFECPEGSGRLRREG